jgi:FAD binding domain/Berberine and berberine like
MKIVRPGDPEYDKDRQIANARFDYHPAGIYYCENADDVGKVIRTAREQQAPIRIRSGGHQHEGMCSGNGVLLIDLSSIHAIEYVGADQVWVGAGAALRDVYVDLWQHGSLFSGGGCGDVHVGGLTQGGGWGPVSRKYGLTCDSLVAVEIVNANGQAAVISELGAGSDLLWALRGGGGGNFGVITKFCFRLHPWSPGYTDLTLTWGDQELPGELLDNFVRNWIERFPGDGDKNLTTFMRVSVVDEPGGDRVILGGRYLGLPDQTEALIERLLANQPQPRSADYQPSMDPIQPGTPIAPEHLEHARKTLGTLRGYQPGPALQGADPNLSDTCAGIPLRHKISSGFARREFGMDAIRTLTTFIRSGSIQREARQYVSFHSLGGAVVTGQPSAFAFRDRNFLLQYQAWWMPHAVNLDVPCITWIEKFRGVMAPYTDGAFINFIDRDIPLAEYYKDKMPQLIQIKRSWDPNDFFRFQMSIPVT